MANSRYKIILAGTQKTGKSSFLRVVTQRKFENTYKPTAGIDYHSKILKIEGKDIQLNIYDTDGQGRYNSVQSPYNKANAIILFYDVTNKQSFEALASFIKNIKNKEDVSPDCDLYLVGSKADLAKKKGEVTRQVAREVAEQFARDNGLTWLGEVSAKKRINTEEIVVCIVNRIMNKKAPQNNTTNHNQSDSLNLPSVTLKHRRLPPSSRKSALVGLITGISAAILVGAVLVLCFSSILAIPFIAGAVIVTPFVAAALLITGIVLVAAIIAAVCGGVLYRKYNKGDIIMTPEINSIEDKKPDHSAPDQSQIHQVGSTAQAEIAFNKTDTVSTAPLKSPSDLMDGEAEIESITTVEPKPNSSKTSLESKSSEENVAQKEDSEDEFHIRALFLS